MIAVTKAAAARGWVAVPWMLVADGGYWQDTGVPGASEWIACDICGRLDQPVTVVDWSGEFGRWDR